MLTGIVAIALWALAPAFIKIGQGVHDFSWFLVMRYTFTTLVIMPFLLKLIKKAKQLPIRDWLSVCLSVSLHNSAAVYCLQEISVIWYTLAFSLSPILTIFFFEKF